MQSFLDAFNVWRLSHGRLTAIVCLVCHAVISLMMGDYMAAGASLAGAVGLHPHTNEQPPAPPSSPAPAVSGSPATAAKAA